MTKIRIVSCLCEGGWLRSEVQTSEIEGMNEREILDYIGEANGCELYKIVAREKVEDKITKTQQLVFKGKDYDLKTDHTEIKKQIKEWEQRLDKIIIEQLTDPSTMRDELENMSHEMMAINM